MRPMTTVFTLVCVIVFLIAPFNAAAQSVKGEWSVMVRPFWQEGDQDPIDNIEGYNYVSKGLYFNVGRNLSDRHSLGITLGHINTEIDAAFGEHTEIESNSVGIYVTLIFRPVYIVSGISYTKGEIDFSHFYGASKGDTESNAYSVYGIVGYPLSVKSGILVTPYVEFSTRYLETDAYQETGLSDNYVKKDEDWYVNTTTGIKATFSIIQKKLDLSVKAAWFHEYTDNMRVSIKTRSALANDYTVSDGVNSSDDRGICGMGIRFDMSKHMSFSAGYDYIFAENFEAHSGIIGLNMSF